ADPEKVAATLERLGRSADELQAAVELLLRRRDWRQQLDARPAVQREAEAVHSGVGAAIAARDAAIQKAWDDCAAAAGPLEDRQGEIARLLRESEDARRKLLETSPHTDVTARAQELRDKATEKGRQAAEENHKAQNTPVQPAHQTAEAAWDERRDRPDDARLRAQAVERQQAAVRACRERE